MSRPVIRGAGSRPGRKAALPKCSVSHWDRMLGRKQNMLRTVTFVERYREFFAEYLRDFIFCCAMNEFPRRNIIDGIFCIREKRRSLSCKA